MEKSVKLAQLLNHRADIQKRLKDLKNRINRNLLVQEGEQPSEEPSGLLSEYQELVEQWKAAVRVNEHEDISDSTIKTQRIGLMFDDVFAAERFELADSPDKIETDRLLSELSRYHEEIEAAYRQAEVDSDNDFERLGLLLKENLYSWWD